MKASRRAVVGGLIAAPLLSSRVWAATKPLDVVVVGAGLAGLNAAAILESQGLKVQVVEASDRVGGRLRTARVGDYQAELGASEVGPLYGRVRDALQKHSLALSKPLRAPTDVMINVGGVSVKQADWAASPANRTRGAERAISPLVLGNKLFFGWLPFKETSDWLDPTSLTADMSAADFMRSKGVSEAAIALANVDVNAPNISSVSALSMFRDIARSRAEGYTDPNKSVYAASESQLSYIRDGSDALPSAMAKALKLPVKLNSPVVAIEQDANGAVTRLQSGEALSSRFVVVAAPFSAVRRIAFSPALPPTQADAIDGAMYARTTQFHFRITKKYWEADGLPPSIWSDGAFDRAFALRSNASGEIDTLLLFINGDTCLPWDVDEADKLAPRMLDALAQVRPSMAGALEYVTGYSWGRNRWIQGQKHVFGGGQVRRFALEMGKPAGRIHWAGEHLRRLEHGMEAAMETGEAAALEIIERQS